MQLDLSSNYFQLFELPVQFELDQSELQRRYRDLQRATHPDNFAAATAAERRWSVQAAAQVNSAHQTLAKPLDRAAYLLKLLGVDLDMETDTHMAPEFLMTQMELRESLESIDSSADPYAAVDKTRSTINDSVQEVTLAFASAYGDDKLEIARGKIREWQFLDKLLRELGDIEARLDEQE